MRIENYIKPEKLSEALEMLANIPDVKILAGGTDLIVKNKVAHVKDSWNILDVGELAELKGIKENGSEIKIGALVTMGALASSEIVKKYLSVLFSAVVDIGSVQIRNRATIGGNIANASPAGDSIPALFVYEARIVVAGTNGERSIPIEKYFTGPGKTVLAKDEIIKEILVKKEEPQNSFGFFRKIGQRKAVTISKVNCAANLKIKDKKIESIKIAFGSVAPTVIRAYEAEKYLTGKVLSKETIEDAGLIARSEVKPIDDIRSTVEYRRELSANLLKDGLLDILFKL